MIIAGMTVRQDKINYTVIVQNNGIVEKAPINSPMLENVVRHSRLNPK